MRKELEKIPKSYWIRAQQVSIRGTPDFLGCVNGHFVGLEVKRSKGESKKRGRVMLQRYVLGKITEANGRGLIVFPENVEKILGFLRLLASYDELPQFK